MPEAQPSAELAWRPVSRSLETPGSRLLGRRCHPTDPGGHPACQRVRTAGCYRNVNVHCKFT